MRYELTDALSHIDYSDVTAARAAVVDVMQRICGMSADAAAYIAAEFYDGLRERQIGERMGASAESLREPAATEGAVRAFVQDLVAGKQREVFDAKCASRLDYEIRRAANLCVESNARRDPEKPKWARVPTGDETCAFCIMLASRGFVYHTRETASHAHANCDCRIVPSWDKDNPAVQGYDPDLYYDMWKHPEKYDKHEMGDEFPEDASSPALKGFARISGVHSSKEDLAAVNPNYVAGGDPRWARNCQRCVAAYEMRRRGYDVKALPRILNGNDRLPFMRDPDGWPHVFENPNLIKCASNTGLGTKAKVESQMARWGDGARAIVRVQWRGGNSGHVFIAEQVGGRTVFIDPQTNDTDCSRYFTRVKKAETYCMRIDDRGVTDLIRKCCI